MSQIKTKFIENAAVTGAKIESNVALAGSPTTTTQSAGDNSTKIATTAYVEAAVSSFQNGFSWQESVIDRLATPPGSPTTGDRYLVIATATGDFTGQEDKIAEYNGASYDFTTPSTGYAVVVEDELDGIYIYGGVSWSKKGFEATTGGAGTTLNVNAIDVDTDGTTIEINGSDQVAVVAGGIGTTQLADDGVTAAKLNSNTAGDGLTQNGTTGALEIATDGVDKTKLDPDVAGLGLSQAAGGELDVNADGTTIEIATDTLQVVAGGIGSTQLAADSVTAAKLNADTAGLGLTQAAGGELDVNVDDVGIEIVTDTVQLKDGGVTEAKLNSGVDAQTFEATHTATNYTPAQVGTEGATKVSAHLKGIDTALGSLTSTTPNKETFTLAAGDITNQYVDLANVALASSISFLPDGGPEQREGTDYTVNLIGGAGGNTQITFTGDLATGGDAALVAGDVIVIKYDYEA
jgi:hypothetical protein